MEADNHFNFDSHPASANSGTKFSSGDAYCTNGSISLPQSGKNMNGDVNLNGITTVKASSQSHPLPSTPYTLIDSHHLQSELDYGCRWEQQQYGPPMSIGPRATLQQEHRQSQPNCGLVASCPPSVSVGKHGYWNRGTPSQQHSISPKPMEYSLHGAFQSQAHLTSIAPQQHHHNLQPQQHNLQHKHQPSQQQQHKPSQQQHHQHQPSQQQNQSSQQQDPHQPFQLQHQHQPSQQQIQPPQQEQLRLDPHQPCQQEDQHQPSPQHQQQLSLQQKHQPSPQQQHQGQLSQQHQQQGPYGMMFSGISCFHQLGPHSSHPPAEVLPPFSQSYAPQSSSPEQHYLGQRSASCQSMQIPSAAHKDSTPVANNGSLTHTVMPGFSHSNGHMNEGCEEVNVGSGGSDEQLSVTQQLPKNEGLPSLQVPPSAPPPTPPCRSQPQHTFVDHGSAPMSQWLVSRDAQLSSPSPFEKESRCETPNQQGFAVERDSSVAMTESSLGTGGKQEVSSMNLGREGEASVPQFHSLVVGLVENRNGPVVSSGSKAPEHPPCIPQKSSCPDPILRSVSKDRKTANGIPTMEDCGSASHLEESHSDGLGVRPPHPDHTVHTLPPSKDSRLEEFKEEEDVQDAPGLNESAAVGVWMEEMPKVPCETPASSTESSMEEDHAFPAPASHGSLCEKESKDDSEDGSGPQDQSEDETAAPSLSDASAADLLASSPSNCQDPFCSHPYPPSPGPPPAKPKVKRKRKAPKIPKVEVKIEDHCSEEEEEVPLPSGRRRRIATEEQVHFPLIHGWRREVRVRRCENRLKGETWYYSPCGKRMKQFPEVIKYLKRHQTGPVSREHFSFSPRMPVGDFFEERETAEGSQWLPLADEEVPSMIMAITGRRGRPPNPDRERARPRGRRALGTPVRRPGRPHGSQIMDLLRKVDARLLQKLESREILSEEEKEKLKKIKRKMKRKLNKARDTDQEWEDPGVTSPRRLGDTRVLEQRGWRKFEAMEEGEPGAEAPAREKRASFGRSEAKALAKARAEKEAQVHAAEVVRRQVERRAQLQRHLEERRRQQFILEQLKKPTEDMCLTDHQPLPELPGVPGLVLSGRAFAHCLQVVEFVRSFGKVLALQLSRDMPTLATLQEGLLGLGGSEGELLDLLVQLVQAALHDPGLPSYYQSVKILGERLGDLELNPSSVSEGLRIFLESRGFEPAVCASLRTRPFQAHSPDDKAAIMAFLVEELNGSSIITKELDNTLEKMATYRKNKWISEGKLRKLKAALAQQTGCSAEELRPADQRRTSRTEESLGLDDSSTPEKSSNSSRKEEAQLAQSESTSSASIPDLERQIDKLTKRQVFFRKKLLHASHSLRAACLGEDRYRRRYWVVPHIGAILVEGSEEVLGDQGDVFVSEEAVPDLAPIKKEAKPEPLLTPPPPPPPAPPPVEADPPPEVTSLMCSPSGRGRPRKIKPELELHLRAAKSRRRRRGSKVGREEVGGANPQENDSVKEEAERQGQWFNLLPKTPCDPALPSGDFTPLPGALSGHAASHVQLGQLFLDPRASPQVCSTPLPRRGRRRGGSAAGLRGPPRRRGRPPSVLLQQIEQQYLAQLVVKPIPAGMARGWWWVSGPEELAALLRALHPRGVREKALHKHLSKHSEYLAELSSQPPSDPMFQRETAADVSQAGAQAWEDERRAMEADLSVLQWVEDLEQRVLTAQLHVKDWTLPELDSTRQDLQYHEHQLDPQDDWVIKPRKEWSAFLRLPTNPLDLAVLRLGRLECALERRYLREPLWSPGEVVRLAPLALPSGEGTQEDLESVESEITLRLRAWRQALDRCRSSAQLSLCLMQLERAIAWERSAVKTVSGEQRPPAKQKSRVRKRLPGELGSSDEEDPPRRGQRRDAPSPYARFSGDSCSPAKRRRVATRNQPDLTFCEIILMEMEAHSDAWPFLEPVNPRLVPGYRRIIKNPMDFLTMRERLLQGGYCSCEEFAADARLVFDNCELFNEDTSEVGVAGHSMRRFFESRWAEFYHNKGQ